MCLHAVERGNYPDAPDQHTTIPIANSKTKVCHKLCCRELETANLSFNIYYLLRQALLFVSTSLERPSAAFTSPLVVKLFAALLMNEFIILRKTFQACMEL